MLKSCNAKLFTLAAALCLTAGAVQAQSVQVGVSGDAVIGKDSVKVGEPFTLDISISTPNAYKGFTLGFSLYGKSELKTVQHRWTTSPEDSAFKP
ncbi:MAG TPA: hypothetical protein VLB27_10220, partial [candidate division Zixibacteria bacterium]|nr:hypothetical protein [candidate division Zixibacteria bacterium]